MPIFERYLSTIFCLLSLNSVLNYSVFIDEWRFCKMSKIQVVDQVEVESIALGYSASTLGVNEACNANNSEEFLKPVSLFDKSSVIDHSSNSLLLSSKYSAPTKPPIHLKKWFIQPVSGSQAIKVCGTKASDGVFHKSSSIKMRVCASIFEARTVKYG